MKNNRTRKLSQRVRYAIIAGMAGAFLIPQVGFAAPTGEHDYTAGVNVDRATANTTKITATATNNVINWRDYSVNHGELVQYDGGNKTNNYLNIVTGANTSNINGKIEGGNNVYIVNPNGVIFGKGAEVNVGHLHVSTQDGVSSTAKTAFESAGTSPLVNNATLKADVVNMGKITATTVEVHGAHIRFLNAADVKTSGGTLSSVDMYTAPAASSATDPDGGYAHIGYRTAAAPTNYTVHTASVSPEYYKLVKDKTELDAINTDTTTLAGNYMLEQDIDLGGVTHTPIGGNSAPGAFTGKFDGNFFRVQNFTVSGVNSAGLFGEVSGGRIENVGVSQATITGKRDNSHCYAGGIAGHTTGNSVLKNVYAFSSTMVEGRKGRYGGIVGATDHTLIDSAYSKALIGTDGSTGSNRNQGGGIIGLSADNTDIRNTYSAATNSYDGSGAYFVYIIDPDDKTTITNSYAVTGAFSSTLTGLEAGKAVNTYRIDENGNATPVGLTGTAGNAKTSDRYAGWDINNDGAPGAKWRIYEGRTLPLLTAFMSGTATATYNYRYFKSDGTLKDDTGNAVKSNDGKDITAAYNSYYMKVVDGSTSNPTTAGTKANVSFGAGADTSHVTDYINSSTKDYDRTNGIRNAGTKAMLWSDQDGPNLRGVNVTITPRDVRLDSGNIKPERMYNGKSDVTKAFRDALTSGSITSSGFTQEDRDAGTVQLDFNKPGKTFKARMVDSDGNDTRNVGTHNVKFSGEIGFTGADAGNYTFDGSSLSNLTGTATITKAPLYLTIQKKTADDKIYDGTSVVKDSAMFQTSGSENIKLDKTKTGLTLAQINAGTPTMPDGAIMTGDDDTTRDDVALTNVGGPKYTDEAGVEQLHAGPHKLQYTNVGLTGNDAGNYELYYTPASGTKTAVTGGNVYLDGKIIPRQILRDDFNVYDKTTHAKVDAKKVYDGNDEYTPTSDVYLSSNAVTGGTTGLVERDRNHITFALTGGKGRFAQNDGTTYSKNVRDVEKLAYEVTGHTDDATNYRLSDYYIMDGTTKKDLGSTFRATGAGKITPKALTATVVNQHITKVYDAMDDQTDGKRHIIKGDDLVTLSGFVGTESRLNTSTAKYATKNVVLDGSGNPTTQSVTYTASFDVGTGVEADNYTLGTEGVTPIATTKTLTSGYTGTITPRNVTVKFADVTKVYDGTVTNTQITASDLDDGLNKDVLNADSLGVGNLNTTGVTSRYGDNKTATTFAENRNAGSRTVEYAGLTNALGTNYKLDAKQYGDGTITRRRIDPSGFKVRKSDGTLADATKVYDGTDTYNLPSGAYLTGSSASGDTGIVSHDFGKVVFELKTNSPGHFTKDAAGANRTSHKSEARYIAYDVKAKTLDPTNNPLSNYTFGVAGSPRNLETVTDATPAQVTAGGSITPASLRAATQEISKVYDGLTAHTDGNRNPVKGDTVVSFTGWAVHDGTTEKRTNSSTAEYATKDVAYDGSGNVIKKSVTYTGQLTGQYADDYQIVDAGNHVISTANGSGAAKTVTMNAPITVADAGKITPRKLNIKMGDVSKTYDGTAGNTSATVTGFTDDPASSVLADVLGVDNVTATRLTNRYQGMVSPANTTTTSTYGRGNTDATFGENVNASNGTPHDVQYTNMRNAFKNEFGSTTAGNYTVDDTVYGKGTINRRDISPNNFQVIDLNGHAANATKVYDGTPDYKVPTGWGLSPSSGPGTGIITADQNDVFFRLNKQGAQFADNSDNPTANVASAAKVLYNVEAAGDTTKIKNYTLNGVNLESGVAKVSGGGSITRRVLELDLVQNAGIDKVYDGTTTLKNTATKNWNALRDSDSTGNVRYATGATAKDKLVTTDGTSFNITSNYMESGSADKNVKRSGGNIVDKDILYKVAINGNATNYSFKKGGTVTNAESGLELSATGKITPKDLSGALKKVTKVYDGTKNVDPAAVGLESGLNGVVSGDTVTLGSHTESFQSENVNGDGVNKWTPAGETEQKNWVNYLNLSLTGRDAGNYKISSKAKGLGEITPYQLNPTTVTLTTNQASKTYDGSTAVKWTNGSSAVGDVKNYITGATVNIGTNQVSVLGELELDSANYDTKNVAGGAQPRVTYNLKYKGTSGNFSLAPGNTTFAKQGNGIITKKDVTAMVRSPLTKTYDAGKDVVGVAKNNADQVVANASDNITLTGLVAGDGTTYTTTATYANKNAGDNKRIDYTLNFTTNGGNYNLKYNGVDNAGTFSTNNNTITKRKVDVTFAPVSKSYDGTPTNTSITPSVSAADASVLSQDNAARVSGTTITGLTGVTSQYGTGTTDATFTPDRNAGAKSVQYAGLGAAMGTAFGANNYEFATNGYGTGTITKANINTSDITFATTGAHKVYDGTRTVKYNGSSAKADVKNYITTATANLGGGHTADLRGDLEIDEVGTHYNSPNATNGTPDTVTYKFRLNNNNIEISGANEFEMTDSGTIDRRKITVDLAQKTGIDKIYDANPNLVDTNTRHYNKFVDDDALGNVAYAAGTTNDTKLVRTSNGAEVNDGAAMTVTASYADKNVAYSGGSVTTKNINYNVRIAGSNYELSDGVTTVNAEDGLDLSASGTISKRAITLGFADVSKPYDTTATNNTKTVTSVTAGNTDGRGAATLTADGITNGSFNMAGVASLYGAGNTDAAFQRNPNVVADANGNVIHNGKDVQYSNLAGTLAAHAYAGNYDVVDTAYGKGTIRKRSVTANDFQFNITNATKMYDGTKDVEYVENGQTYKDLAHVKKRFQTSKLDLGGGNLVDINLDDIELTGAAYNDERVAHADGVNYDVTINTKNFEFNGARTRRIQHTGDTITKRDLATKLPRHLVKEYDGEDTFTETNEIFANAMARANLTGVVDRDKKKIQLKVKGTYGSPDASVETRADAEARTPATAGRNVAYELTLSGDANTLSNYKIGTVETLDSNGEMKGNGSGKADIYKKTLTVSADQIDKVYDGTRTVVRPNGSTTAPHPAANKLKLNGFAKSADHFDFDQTAADKIDGLYSDPNVSRAADGTILDKDIAYSGVKAAFKNYADNHAGSAARNYRVDSDTVSGKGKITPRQISSNDITNGLTFSEASKVYDGTTKVKYNGQNTPDALKNYLTSATVNINGTPIDIKNDLTIRADEASTHYDTANVAGGAQPRVTYTLNYTGGNFDITGPITKTANGVITKRQVTAYAPGQLTKKYDGTLKVYDSGDPTIKTYYRGNQVTSGADIVQLEKENGDRGLLMNDGVQNISTAMFRDKNAGTRKVVDYNIAVDAAHAGNYELVDQRGNVISQTSTNNNTITPRHLDITFGDVSRAYDGTSTNTDVTALVKDSDARATLRRDGVNPSGERLILRDAANNDIILPSDYGYGRTDSAFTKNADANQTGEPLKDVQYRKLGDAMRTLLGNNAGNYDFDETGYGKGRITKASVSESDFRMKFKDAVKEYDGTDAVNDARSRLDPTDSRMRLPRAEGWKPFALQDKDIADIKGTYQPTGGKRSKDASENSRGVQYEVQLSKQNFDFENGWNGKIRGDGAGKINRRAITAETLPYLTKEYDGTRGVVNAARDADGNLITRSGDGLMRFRHAHDAAKRALITGDDVSNATTATCDTENVAWKDGVWNQGNGTAADVGVTYALGLSGADAANYKIVDSKGTEVTNAKGLGKITPKDIHLKADPQTRWINEGLPKSYTGKPMGSNLGYNDIPELLPNEVLPGSIDYSSPNARLRWGNYMIRGDYHALNGTDGDSVARNYRFVQDPANATALHIGPYIPDYEYYKALTQTSKMIPDEYAYENASLDRHSNFGRDAEAEIAYMPPSINMVKDGVDISKTDVRIADETVFSLVNEVFGA